ncbi:hypothetical protein K1T71_008667 [Dendrolimus kikuchii]|uniref:Uncharacterized protein n=1 Tax=Dendrolimus kikuchii TaxID=765133 RepID=A0ACC1CV44_9NEOP|nr:hypothetical protein K1T71_008667 [Dendrolimus kikuchii]
MSRPYYNAFKNAGLIFGIFGTLFMGALCTHCMHMLVQCSRELCIRNQRPALSFSEVNTPAQPRNQETLLVVIHLLIHNNDYLLLTYTILHYTHPYHRYNIHHPLHHVNKINPSFILSTMIIKFIIIITCPAALLLPLIKLTKMTVLPLENNMKTPDDFGGWSGVLNTGMVIVAALYTAIGFFGYLKYGDKVEGSITLNLPKTLLAQSVRAAMAASIFLSYGLQFYVPMNIVWPYVKSKLESEKALKHGEAVTRFVLITLTFTAAALIPNLSGIISLVGAFSSSALALIFPPLIEIVTFWPDQLGKNDWKLWKDVLIVLFGITGFVFGTYSSVKSILYSP